MPIRILHIVTYMGRGGLETMLMNYYRSIDRTKVQFDFLTHRDFEADYDAEILALGGRIYHLPPLNPFSRGYLAALDRFFAEHPEYRIVHSHLDCMAGIPLKYAKKHGVPVRIAHAHSSNQAKDKKYLLKLLYKRMIPGTATNLFACSAEAGSWMFNRDDFHVLNNAIDTGQYAFDPEVRRAYRRELGICEGTLVVGHVGRFDPQKNHSFLLDVFSKIPGEPLLLLVGDGPLRAEAEKHAQRLNIRDRVIFTGIRSDVHALLQAMDVFVFPSLCEGLGIVAVEAQASGLSCLISDGVPMACKATDLIVQLPLSVGAKQWADEVLKTSDILRRNTMEEIIRSGFDITENALWLENYYLSEYRRYN